MDIQKISTSPEDQIPMPDALSPGRDSLLSSLADMRAYARAAGLTAADVKEAISASRKERRENR